MTASETDETLLERIAHGDREAFAQLHERHAQVVYGLIMRIVRDTAVADELLQETFWQAWEKASQYDGRGAAAAWLYRIGRNKSLDELRRQKARPQPIIHQDEEAQEKVWAQLEAQGTNVETIAARKQRRHQVREALGHLPDEQRQCLELAYFDGLSQRQIAEETDTPLGTVKTRIRLAMGKLESLLKPANRL